MTMTPAEGGVTTDAETGAVSLLAREHHQGELAAPEARRGGVAWILEASERNHPLEFGPQASRTVRK